jgi:23S rRNA-/tRNA-specific pseudouridylate synthase
MMAGKIMPLFWSAAAGAATGRTKLDKPAAIHRLDKPTSGCLAIGVHSSGRRRLTNALQKGKIVKTYLAVVRGKVEGRSGTIDAPLSETCFICKTTGYSVIRVDRENGKSALTEYQVLSTTGSHSFLALSPLTGRTHQLRVHCAHIGHPIVGDPWYPGGEVSSTPLHLHAFRLVICSDVLGDVKVTAKLPEHMKATLRHDRQFG